MTHSYWVALPHLSNYEVEVEADNADEAKSLGLEQLAILGGPGLVERWGDTVKVYRIYGYDHKAGFRHTRRACYGSG